MKNKKAPFVSKMFSFENKVSVFVSPCDAANYDGSLKVDVEDKENGITSRYNITAAELGKFVDALAKIFETTKKIKKTSQTTIFF